MAVGIIGLDDAWLGRIGAAGIAPLGELVVGVDEPGVGQVAGWRGMVWHSYRKRWAGIKTLARGWRLERKGLEVRLDRGVSLF